MAFNLTPASITSNIATGLNLINSVAKIDVIGVLDQQTMVQLFPGARPMKATVRESARVMDYPIETGSIRSDHKIQMPTEIELITIINEENYASAYQALRNCWVNATLLSVQTRTGTYRNMIVSDMPHEENADMFNAVTQAIRLREIIYGNSPLPGQPVALQNYSPRDPVNQPSIGRGLLSTLTAPLSALSYFRALSIWGK